jgi:hypothetical protein
MKERKLLQLLRRKRLIKERVAFFRKKLENGSIIRQKNVSKFVFLCGANKDENSMSERRKALMAFSKEHLPNVQFFIAERIFSELKHEGNILDIENDISEFADIVLIVLESESAFTELGAFSHEKLRSKLIIINDKKYEKSNSFVNLGPIKAIEEAKGKEYIISYKMKENGVQVRDAIGDVFNPLFKLLKEPLPYKSMVMQPSLCNPALLFNKDSIMFIHDLIYIAGPIYYRELVELLLQIFGTYNFKHLKEHLAMLIEFQVIEKNKNLLYRSILNECYLKYQFDLNKIISIFRNISQKYYQDRIYEY